MGDHTEADNSLQCHYEVNIQNFSMIKSTVEIYKSAVFEAGGYKWKLVVHPNGNKLKKVKDRLSFYLALAERVELGWEVDAVFRLYLRTNSDQFADLDFGTRERCFNPLKLEHGVDDCTDFETLNRFLEGDSCIFGAKILSVSRTRTKGKAECLSMFEIPTVMTHTWKIDKFSTKISQDCLGSETFGNGNIAWKIQLYPRAKDHKGTDLSIYLALVNPTSFVNSYRIYAKVILKIMDESKGRNTTIIDNFWFSVTSPEQGWSTVDFDGFQKCFSIRFRESDVFLIQAKVTIRGTADAIIP